MGLGDIPSGYNFPESVMYLQTKAHPADMNLSGTVVGSISSMCRPQPAGVHAGLTDCTVHVSR